MFTIDAVLFGTYPIEEVFGERKKALSQRIRLSA